GDDVIGDEGADHVALARRLDLVGREALGLGLVPGGVGPGEDVHCEARVTQVEGPRAALVAVPDDGNPLPVQHRQVSVGLVVDIRHRNPLCTGACGMHVSCCSSTDWYTHVWARKLPCRSVWVISVAMTTALPTIPRSRAATNPWSSPSLAVRVFVRDRMKSSQRPAKFRDRYRFTAGQRCPSYRAAISDTKF